MPPGMGHAGRQGGRLGAITAPCGSAGRGDAQAPGKVGQQWARSGKADLGGSGDAARASHVDLLQEWRLRGQPFPGPGDGEGALWSPSLRWGHVKPAYWRFCNYPSGLFSCSHTPSLSPLAWPWTFPALLGTGGAGGACSFFRPWRRRGSLLSSALTKVRGTEPATGPQALGLAVDPRSGGTLDWPLGWPGYAGTRPHIRCGVICTRVVMAHAHHAGVAPWLCCSAWLFLEKAPGCVLTLWLLWEVAVAPYSMCIEPLHCLLPLVTVGLSEKS